ncbi:MAG: hypothetical protein KA712_16830 [Myxococcales bacterium]|nr:hypothetical protein [Myxococcales bacterium]
MSFDHGRAVLFLGLFAEHRHEGTARFFAGLSDDTLNAWLELGGHALVTGVDCHEARFTAAYHDLVEALAGQARLN